MHQFDRGMQQDPGRQTGTTLILALVLVLLATLMGVFAVKVGIFGQRISANDVRARLVQQTAEGALAQGIEYINLAGSTSLDTTNAANWQRCNSSDTSFPCGAVPQCAPKFTADSKGYTSDGSTGCTGDLARRGNMYRFIGGGTYDVNGANGSSDFMDVRSLPIDRQMASVGNGYTVNYGVGAVLCMVKTPNASTDPTECTIDPTLSTGTTVITLVSTANISGESAKTTLTTTIGRSGSLFAPVNKPPVIASGTVIMRGTFNVVTNPNAGGKGVPVSVWTRKNVDPNGTPNSCYMDGYIHGSSSPVYEGTKPPIITCDSCNCSDSLSGKNNQGIDIVDVDPSTQQCTNSITTNCKPNLDIKQGEFPCDLFQYTFGDQAWQDTDNDGFCETRITVSVTASNGHTYTIGEDENYLLAKATYIVDGGNEPYAADLPLLTNATILTSCPASTVSGMIWDMTGNCPGNGNYGTSDKPVVMISDGSVAIHGGSIRFFGLLFVRPSLYGPSTGPLIASTGATASNGANLDQNAQSVIYGSVVVQGTVNRINGTGSIIYSSTVLSNLGSEDELNKIAPVPGSWSDRYAY